MKMPPRRQPISLELKREYSNVKPKGKISEIIDFHLAGKNRYLKINQPRVTATSSGVSTPRKDSNSTRTWTRFKNPNLNRYDDAGEEEYERKQYVFEFQDDESESETKITKNVKKVPRRKVNYNYNKSDNISNKNSNYEEPDDDDKIEQSEDNNPANTKRISRDDVNQEVSSNDLNKPIVDEKKVGETVKLLEDLLKDKKKTKKSRADKDKATDKDNDNDKLKEERTDRKSNHKSSKGDKESKSRDKHRKRKHRSKDVVKGERDEEDEDDEEQDEKEAYLKEKNIQINLSTIDTDDINKIAKKPKKKNAANDLSNLQGEILLDSSAQTPRDLLYEMKKDHLQHAPTANIYVNKLIDDVEVINKQVQKETDQLEIENGFSVNRKNKDKKMKFKTFEKIDEAENDTKDASNGYISDRNDVKKKNKNSDDKSSEKRVKSLTNLREDEKSKKHKGQTNNSLGLSMEGKNGINMAIIKGGSTDFENNPNLSELEKTKLRNEPDDQVLLRQNYQNLEGLINHLMEKETDENYLKLAKLNRLKVLMELSMKMVGRKYKDIGNQERNTLDLQANRFHTTYPLPGEETALEEIDENGNKTARMPLKVVSEDGAAKIDVNDKYRIDPSEFLKIYTTKLINHAQDSTGLDFDNITVTIPAAYGAQQREAIKNSFNEAADRDDIKILTRPVAAAVILNNQRNNSELEREQSVISNNSNPGEYFKVVFDITEASLDASVIKVKDSKDFQVVSNVGDTNFGIQDIDERIVEHIIKEKANREAKSGRKFDSEPNNVETVNAYSSLVKNIKQHVVENGAVSVDLATMNQTDGNDRAENEVIISKNLISRTLCKDIYDWSLAHIEKAINQADVNDKDIDEIILIGSPSKMPGFLEYLREAYPQKKINYVPEEDLAVGAAIVGRKLKYQQIKVTEVLCRSIGIGLYTGVITYLLFRNSSLPCVGGCVYSTLVDDQESMVLDVYEGERPHVKFCRYLGEVTILGLPKGEAGKIKCEVYLKMNHEGLLEVTAKETSSGKSLETMIDANPENLNSEDVNNETELDPIEAERYKKPDYELVYQLEVLDEYLESLSAKYRKHQYSKFILDKIFDTKEWLYNNRRKVCLEETQGIRNAIDKFLNNMESLK